MNSEYYETEASKDCLEFRFKSVSEAKTIEKIITFTCILDSINLYNLAFGDLKADGSIDDLIVSNNDDREKVMATVLQSVYAFFLDYPHSILYIKGSTAERTRLYRIIISKELVEFQKEFEIFGWIESEVELFTRNRPYTAFVIKRKN